MIGDGFTFLARLSHEPYNGEEGLKIKTRDYQQRHDHHLKVIYADQIDRTRANRTFYFRPGIRLSGPRLGRVKSDPELLAEDKRQFLDDRRQ